MLFSDGMSQLVVDCLPSTASNIFLLPAVFGARRSITAIQVIQADLNPVLLLKKQATGRESTVLCTVGCGNRRLQIAYIGQMMPI